MGIFGREWGDPPVYGLSDGDLLWGSNGDVWCLGDDGFSHRLVEYSDRECEACNGTGRDKNRVFNDGGLIVLAVCKCVKRGKNRRDAINRI